MKKDKEWLKGLINEEGTVMDMNSLGRHDGQYWKNENIKINKGRLFYLIDQLDEPEVLSQEWIDENKVGRINGVIKKTTSDVVTVIKLKNLLVPKQEITFEQAHDKLREESILSEKSFDYYWNCINDNVEIDEQGNLLVPKQDKPVIPKFIANWIESYRKKTLVELINDAVYSSGEDIKYFRIWFHEEMGFESNYSEFLSRVWLDGYEVEEEQKYQVIIRDGEYIRLFLCKHGDNVMIGTNGSYIENCPEATYLTEKEIKDYDERYFAFAVKVEELEE